MIDRLRAVAVVIFLLLVVAAVGILAVAASSLVHSIFVLPGLVESGGL